MNNAPVQRRASSGTSAAIGCYDVAREKCDHWSGQSVGTSAGGLVHGFSTSASWNH